MVITYEMVLQVNDNGTILGFYARSNATLDKIAFNFRR